MMLFVTMLGGLLFLILFAVAGFSTVLGLLPLFPGLPLTLIALLVAVLLFNKSEDFATKF